METNETKTEQESSSTVSQEATETISDVTPAQESKTEDNAGDATNTSKENSSKEESWEYDGNRAKVPEPFKKYATGFDRYLSKKDQALAEARKKVEEYESKLKSYEQRSNPSPNTKEEPESLVTQDEIDAIALGDGKTLQSVIERAVNKRLEASVTPIAQKQRELEAAETIKAFSDIHPDFQELIESPAGEFMIDAARRGANLEQIYKTAKEAEAYFSQKSEVRRKADLEAKRAGSVVGKSVPGTPEIVYADNEDQAKRLAIELTLKGDKRSVQVKNKRQ